MRLRDRCDGGHEKHVCVCVCERAGVKIEVTDGLEPARLRTYEDTW